MAAGDLYFFHGTWSSLDSIAIQLWTWGPRVHVEAEVEDGLFVGALSNGVSIHPLHRAPYDVFHSDLITTSPYLVDGLTFLRNQVGDPYGWGDIIDDVTVKFLPRKFLIRDRHAFDCSDLIVRFLQVVKYPLLPQKMYETPEIVSPNSLFRALNSTKNNGSIAA